MTTATYVAVSERPETNFRLSVYDRISESLFDRASSSLNRAYLTIVV